MDRLPGDGVGVRTRSQFVRTLYFLIPTIVVLSVVFPYYKEQRAKEEVAVMLDQAERMAQAVDAYRTKNGKLPASVAEAGFDEPLVPYARDVTIAPDGSVTLEYQGPVIDGKKLTVSRAAGADGKAAWKCVAEEIPEAYRPGRCAAQQ